MTDFLMAESIRDFCDSWVVCTGILLILLVIYLGKTMKFKKTDIESHG